MQSCGAGVDLSWYLLDKSTPLSKPPSDRQETRNCFGRAVFEDAKWQAYDHKEEPQVVLITAFRTFHIYFPFNAKIFSLSKVAWMSAGQERY